MAGRLYAPEVAGNCIGHRPRVGSSGGLAGWRAVVQGFAADGADRGGGAKGWLFSSSGALTIPEGWWA
jgi:hypothetical protein